MGKTHFVLIIACLAVLAIPGTYAQGQVSVTFDRDKYPIPFGQPENFAPQGDDNPHAPNGRSIFPVHATAIATDRAADNVADAGNHLEGGDLMVYITIQDSSFNLSPTEIDTISQNINHNNNTQGPITIYVARGNGDYTVLVTAGGTMAKEGKIISSYGTNIDAPELGPIRETAPDSGIFQLSIPIRYTDGPTSSSCPITTDASLLSRFDDGDAQHCILAGDQLFVDFTPYGSSSADDMARFLPQDGLLQAQKETYTIGRTMILTLIEPDLNLDSDVMEAYPLDLIEWDSDAATVALGHDEFVPSIVNLEESGGNTGIFQTLIKMPASLEDDSLDRDEEIVLEYTDWSPEYASYVGYEVKDINLTVFTSNFGASIELNQEVYTWTDRVHITIDAQDHNFDPEQIDRIGSDSYPIKISTRHADIEHYTLEENGTDTGYFTGTITLTGFEHDADGDGTYDAPTRDARSGGTGPNDGFIEIEDDEDDITVSFKFSDDNTVDGFALIRWNTGNATWDKSSYNSTDTAIFRITDPDMNLNPDVTDTFKVNVTSSTDDTGIALDVTETGIITGIFEGTVDFTDTGASSGNTLLISANDTITGNYVDRTAREFPHVQSMNTTASINLVETVIQPTASEASIILDKEAYTWTDRVKITVTAPDGNSTTADEILVKVSTGRDSIADYKLTENGINTGNFTGEITLTGFEHDADGDKNTPIHTGTSGGTGPTGGFLQAGNVDTILISFANNGNNITASAPIGWILGTVKWIDANYTVSGSGIFEIIDPDMNLKPDAVDEFKVRFTSSANTAHRDQTAKETGESTGIFQVTVPFTLETSSNKLTVVSNATITGKYEDHTRPAPKPITSYDAIEATKLIEIYTEKNSTETNSTDIKPEEKKPADPPKTTKPAEKPTQKAAEPKQKTPEPKKTTPEPRDEPAPEPEPVATTPIPTPVVPEPDPEPGVDPEPGFDLTADPVCGPGTELVGGACRAIEVQPENFDIIGWLFSLFQR